MSKISGSESPSKSFKIRFSLRLKVLLPFLIIIVLMGFQFITLNNTNNENANDIETLRFSSEYRAHLREIDEALKDSQAAVARHFNNDVSGLQQNKDDFAGGINSFYASLDDAIAIVEGIRFVDERNSQITQGTLMQLNDTTKVDEIETSATTIFSYVPIEATFDLIEVIQLLNSLIFQSEANLQYYYSSFDSAYYDLVLENSAQLNIEFNQLLSSYTTINTFNSTLYSFMVNEVSTLHSTSISASLPGNDFRVIMNETANYILANNGVHNDTTENFVKNQFGNLTIYGDQMVDALNQVIIQAEYQPPLIDAEFTNYNVLLTQRANLLDFLNEALDRNFTDIEIDISNRADTIRNLQFWISGFIIGMTLVVFYLISRAVISPINNISDWSEEIAKGDLRVSRLEREVNSRDEIGTLYNNFKNMNFNLRGIITELQQSSSVMNDTSENLASNTQEINATSIEVSSIAQSMAKGSTHQAELISEVVHELSDTTQIVDSVITQINENLALIKDLTEQINVLSINSAIEAANVGEFGKGFVVISDNIRKMALSSKQTGDAISKDSQVILEKLQSTFTNISEKIENVASVSEETAASAEEVAASAQEMTAILENVSSNSTELSDYSLRSLDIVKRFVIDRDTVLK